MWIWVMFMMHADNTVPVQAGDTVVCYLASLWPHRCVTKVHSMTLGTSSKFYVYVQLDAVHWLNG